MEYGKRQLREILEEVSRPEALEPEKVYNVLGVKWYAKGVWIKDQKRGSEIKAQYLYQVQAGDLIYNRLFAWKGSFAIIPPEFDGCYVSNEFPCFRVNEDQASAEYLFLFLAQEQLWESIEKKSTGVTSISRNRFKVHDFLRLELDLPNLPKQQKVVENHREFSSLHEQLQVHLKSNVKLVGKLRQTVLQLAVQGKFSTQRVRAKRPSSKRVSDYVKILNGYAFKSEWFVKDGVRLLRNANVGHGTIRWNDVVSIPTEQAEEFSRFALAEDDIVISLDRPIIATGVKVARISSKDVPSLLLQRVGKVEFRTDEIDPDFFFIWLHSPLFINSIDPGRSNGVPHISSKSIEVLPLEIPPLEEQKRIVVVVNRLMALCDELEAGLRHAEEDGERLLRAAVRSLLGPASNNSVEVVALAVQ